MILGLSRRSFYRFSNTIKRKLIALDCGIWYGQCFKVCEP
jgi:hypothetical protein